MKTVAIIPAGGAGKRLKSDIAKQYLLLDNIPILVHTLKVFERVKIIDEIILVVPAGDVSVTEKKIIDQYGLKKIKKIIVGGKERQDSVRNGLAAIKGKCDIVIVHDGVRPFVTQAMIQQVVEVAKTKGAVSVGVKANDTVKKTGKDCNVESTIPRDNLWLTQTPQAFKFEVIKQAFKKAYDENYYGTDDASLVERMGKMVKMIEGSYNNIKITTPDDLLIAKALMKKETKVTYRTGFGYDSHRFAESRKMILGGIEIPHNKGLQGHSDADALIHAICDALLGAAGCGDIGRHFPDTDPAYRNISSTILLQKVKEIVEAKGFFINNVDTTVIMEKPKLAPYAVKMVSHIALALDIPETSVNVKAKTNEGMGFTGRNEGVAVLATASVTERMNNG